jgi:hypothetical protein
MFAKSAKRLVKNPSFGAFFMRGLYLTTIFPSWGNGNFQGLGPLRKDKKIFTAKSQRRKYHYFNLFSFVSNLLGGEKVMLS